MCRIGIAPRFAWCCMSNRTGREIEIGTAGEHLVCADLLLQGHRAFLSSAGLPYDLILDVEGEMLRVAVKSTQRAWNRPAREGNRLCYQFCVTRSRRLHTGKTDARFYSAGDVDIVAFCALDIRRVGYCHMRECAQSMHFDPPGAASSTSGRGILRYKPKKTFDGYTIERALGVHREEIEPFPFKWRGRHAA